MASSSPIMICTFMLSGTSLTGSAASIRSTIGSPRSGIAWTNGQVERIPLTVRRQPNRTIKDGTVKRCHYDAHDQLRNHLSHFISAYNSGRRLKSLKGFTPYKLICKQPTIEPKGSPLTQSIECRDDTPDRPRHDKSGLTDPGLT